MSKKKGRRTRRRKRKAAPVERIAPSPLAEKKKRPWSLRLLADIGREGGGLDDDQLEAGLEIVSAWRAVTRTVGYQSASLDGTRASADAFDNARVTAIYRAWCQELERRSLSPATIVAWSEDAAAPIAVEVLSDALDLWLRTKRDVVLTCAPLLVDTVATGCPTYAHPSAVPYATRGQDTGTAPGRTSSPHRSSPPIVKR